MDEVGRRFVRRRQLVQGFIQRDYLFGNLGKCDLQGVEVLAHQLPAALPRPLVPGIVHEDAAHGLGRPPKQMPSPAPFLPLPRLPPPPAPLLTPPRPPIPS